ncbi:hypothetical protein C8R45DRAFT_1090506 [Mycena sanguinolenta]|nr:hypothetical protein C8R45DRAFT_1090506 [Mycena sanguinolenta]
MSRMTRERNGGGAVWAGGGPYAPPPSEAPTTGGARKRGPNDMEVDDEGKGTRRRRARTGSAGGSGITRHLTATASGCSLGLVSTRDIPTSDRPDSPTCLLPESRITFRLCLLAPPTHTMITPPSKFAIAVRPDRARIPNLIATARICEHTT